MTLSIVTVAYRRPENLQLLLRSFVVQTSTDWTMHIIHDGPDPEIEDILAAFAARWPQHFTYEFTEQRYNDYGHTLREMGIQKATGEYLLITNDDNYYVPIFVETVLKVLDASGCGGALVDMIHSYENAGWRGKPAYSLFPPEPKWGQADIGCAVVRTEVAKRIGWRDKSNAGDGVYIEDASHTPGFEWAKINQVLFVHN